jgi:cytoskeleton protein RodZ
MSEAAATLPGPRLKAERERRGLSAQKAADEMHLDRWVIDALEADDYKRIGPTVYAKGHLKKYAALLGLPAGEIMAGYESRPPGPIEITSAGPSMLLATREEGSSIGNWSPVQIFAGLFAAVLVAAVLLWRPWHQRVKTMSGAPAVAVTAAPGPAAAAPIDARDSPAAADTAALNPATEVEAGAAAGGSAALVGGAALGVGAPSSTAAFPAATAAPGSIPGVGHARLRFSFSADSWVDVHDANGRRAFAGNGPANSVKTIAGTAPLRVYLGFGSGVQLEINDRAVAIGPQFFTGDVARFEAGADGVLRRESRNEPAHPDQTRAAPSRNSRPPG